MRSLVLACLPLAALAATACSSATTVSAEGAAELQGTRNGNRVALPLAVWHPGSEDLALWNDPAFRRQFAESYLSETDIEPRTTPTERDQLAEVMLLIGEERVEEASALLVERIGSASSAAFDFTLANLHFQGDQLGPAEEGYAAAVAKFPRFRRAWRNLGLIHVRNGNFAQAVTALARVIELGGGDSVTWGLLGFAQAGTGNELSAESAYRMAALLDPVTPDWKLGLARSLFRQERFADAAALCGGLIAAEPDRADYWLLQANAWLGLDQPLKAAGNFEMVARLGQSTPESLNMLADIYVNEELFDLAVESYLLALDAGPDSPAERPLRAARLLAARGALDPARRLVERIEQLHGGNLALSDRKDLLKLRARMAVADGAGDEEARVLEEIVLLDPLDGEALLLLGQHATRTEDPERAVFYYERAANLEDFEADARVRLAQLHVGQGRYDDALPLLRRAQALKPRDNVQKYLDQVERLAQAR